MLGAYVHVPFCASRCGYCDFNTYTAAELRRDGTTVDISSYADYAQREIEWTAQQWPTFGSIDTVFFGGGTPTLLAAHAIEAMLNSRCSNCALPVRLASPLATRAARLTCWHFWSERILQAEPGRRSRGPGQLGSSRSVLMSYMEVQSSPTTTCGAPWMTHLQQVLTT